MEQFVRQLLEELTLGKLDICTADVGCRTKGRMEAARAASMASSGNAPSS